MSIADEGHTFATREQLIQKGTALLDAPENAIIAALEKMIAEQDLILDNEAIYLPPFYYAETGSANKLGRLIADPASKELPEDIPLVEIEKLSGIRYDTV